MKHCIITPTKYINDPKIGGQSNFLLVLSHLLDNECTNEYATEVKKFKATGKELYLDNGLFENHEPEAPTSLISKAILIGADYVFAPDHLYDAVATKQAFLEFAVHAKNANFTGKLAFVVQAENAVEYITAYKWAENHPSVGLIGLSILAIPNSFGGEITESRIEAIQALELFLDPKKPAHMLGLGSGLSDLEFAKNHPWIISNDSCSAYMTGFFKKSYDADLEVPGGKIEEKVQFDYDGEISTLQRSFIEANIATIKSVCGSK